MALQEEQCPWEYKSCLVKEPCLTCFEDDPDNLRTRMRCGHVLCSECMRNYAENVLKSEGFKFPCPMKPCEVVWKDFEVKLAAYRSVDEQTEFQLQVEKHYAQSKLSKIKPCPGCQTFCFRPQELRSTEIMRCQRCTSKEGKAFDFCWYCEGQTDGIVTKCNKKACNSLESALKVLHECQRVKIINVPSCPSIRACPCCGYMINHAGGCKHMTCDKCNNEFCFVCLRLRDGYRWQCGRFDAKCTPAPVQKYIPGYI